MSGWIVRSERSGDEAAIRRVTAAAFAGNPHSDGSEPAIVDALRANGDLALSLVAESKAQIVGHIAFSPAELSNGEPGWYALGPISVLPEAQGKGVGRALIEAGLGHWRAAGARGLVVVGDPAFYARFGFVSRTPLRVEGPLAPWFLVQAFGEDIPDASASFAPAFDGGAGEGR